MDVVLNEVEVRVLGCLIEKEMTTPEYYPLSLNALTNACNQKSNRDPVMALAEEDVVRALNRMRFNQLTVVSGESSRVAKYRHLLAENMGLVPAELAVICELLVRGPQTVGELKVNAQRLFAFEDLDDVLHMLHRLAEQDPALVVCLPRQPGQKEERYAHLLCGAPVIPQGISQESFTSTTARDGKFHDLEDRISALEAQVTELLNRLS